MAVRLRGVKHSYGDRPAVDDLDLEVKPGELFGFVGPNGAGKTTTMQILAGVLEPAAGEVELFGHAARGRTRELRRRIGLVPQALAVYPDLSGIANVRFFAKLQGLQGRALEDAAKDVLERVGLADRAGDVAAGYSGGMLRRLNLACGLVHGPELLLLDEPTVGVDPQSREHLLQVIHELADGGTTVIYTSHYMEEVERLCDRIAILDQGRLVALGTQRELLSLVGLGEMIEVQGLDDVDAASVVRGWPGVRGVDAADGGLRVQVDRAADVLSPLAQLLERSGKGESASVEIYPVDLERVFIHLTGRALRDR